MFHRMCVHCWKFKEFCHPCKVNHSHQYLLLLTLVEYNIIYIYKL